MREVLLDDFLAEHPLDAPREFQVAANHWLHGLIAHPLAPRLARGQGLINVFDALRSELLLRVGNALRDAALIDALKAHYPGQRLKVEGRAATPGLRRISQALGARWLEVPRGSSLERGRELGWILRNAARRVRRSAVPVPRGLDVLAVPRLPMHLTDAKPVVEQLKERGWTTGFVAPALEESVAASGLLWISLGRVGLKRAAVDVPRLGLECEQLASEVAVREVRSAPAARWALRQVLISTLLELVWFSSALERLLFDSSPRLVLAGNPYTMEGRIASRLAHAYGIPSACLEHGSIFAGDPIWDDTPVDRVLVWGQPSQRALLSCGVPGEKVRVVGAPRTDRFVAASADAKPRRVLVATSGPGDQVSLDTHLNFIELLFEAATQLVGTDLVIKLHPKDSPEHYRDARARHPGARVQLVRGNRDHAGLDIFEHLAKARALVTVTSTCALDAIAVEVPVVAVIDGPPNRYDHIEFLARGCTTKVRTSDELAAALEAALEGRADRATVETARTYASEQFANRGHAAAFAAEELIALAESPRARRSKLRRTHLNEAHEPNR